MKKKIEIHSEIRSVVARGWGRDQQKEVRGLGDRNVLFVHCGGCFMVCCVYLAKLKEMYIYIYIFFEMKSLFSLYFKAIT